ncbi:MAG: response regulator transcription factor [Limisphaerales bacterium]
MRRPPPPPTKAQNQHDKVFGDTLSITEVTVKSHVQSVLKKLNVLSRTEAIAVANRRGLLHPSQLTR